MTVTDFCAASRSLVASSRETAGRQRARWPRKMPVITSVVMASQERACSGAALALAAAAIAPASIVCEMGESLICCRLVNRLCMILED